MTDPIALIRAALEDAAKKAFDRWAHHRTSADQLHELDSVSAAVEARVKSRIAAEADAIRAEIAALDPHAILRRVQEGQHGQG